MKNTLNISCGFVYKITSPTNKIYVGSTSLSLEKRWKRYKTLDCKKQVKLYNSLKKYGVENHTFEEIWFGNINDMLKYEAILGKFYEVLDKNKGLNLKLPKINDIYQTVSLETCKKISLSKIGYKFSQEAKNKMSKSHLNKPNLKARGLKRTKETCEKMSMNRPKICILQYTLNGDFVKEWSSIIEASIVLNLNNNCISRAVSGKFNKAGKFLWKYKINNNYPLKIDKYISGKIVKILQYDLNNVFIKEWDSIAEINLKYGKLTHIHSVLKGERKQTNGFIFKYK